MEVDSQMSQKNTESNDVVFLDQWFKLAHSEMERQNECLEVLGSKVDTLTDKVDGKVSKSSVLILFSALGGLFISGVVTLIIVLTRLTTTVDLMYSNQVANQGRIAKVEEKMNMNEQDDIKQWAKIEKLLEDSKR